MSQLITNMIDRPLKTRKEIANAYYEKNKESINRRSKQKRDAQIGFKCLC